MTTRLKVTLQLIDSEDNEIGEAREAAMSFKQPWADLTRHVVEEGCALKMESIKLNLQG
jgi:hypothetical protein